MASPEEQLRTMIGNLPERTGKNLDDWIKLLAASGLEKHGDLVKHLKTDHGMSHGFANTVAHCYRDPSRIPGGAATAAAGGGGAPTDPVAEQYAGAKADLKPIYDKLVAAIGKFGGDVELAPKKAYVSLRRSKQFGIIQPSTKTRVDVGLNMKGVAPTARLEASGSFNAMVSHRVRLATTDDVDAELIAWLQQAYEGA